MSSLAWFALETVGDDARSCEIFEVAVVITTDRLEPLKQFQSAVMPAQDRPLSVQLRVGGDVRERFRLNGLWDEMAVSSVTPLSAENNLARLFAAETGSGQLTAVASAWDRRVLLEQLPAASNMLRPGSYDVASFVGLAQTFIPRARVPMQPAHQRVAFRLNSEMQNLASVVNALRGAKGTTTS